MVSPVLVRLDPGSGAFFDRGTKPRTLIAGVEAPCLGESLDDWSISCDRKSENIYIRFSLTRREAAYDCTCMVHPKSSVVKDIFSRR